jgi:hypothetical protein
MPLQLHHPRPRALSFLHHHEALTVNTEWRIANSSIEAEMLRLAALLANPARTGACRHAGLARCQAAASNASLRTAIYSVSRTFPAMEPHPQKIAS